MYRGTNFVIIFNNIFPNTLLPAVEAHISNYKFRQINNKLYFLIQFILELY